MSAIDNIPGLAGYVAAQNQGQAQQAGQLQQIGQVIGLQNALIQQQAAQRRNAMMAGLDLSSADPDKLEQAGLRLSAAGDKYGPTLIAQAERMRKAKAATDTFATMKSQPGQVVQPDQQQAEGAFDVGAIPPQPTTEGGKPGLFGSLMQSDNPAIAAQAKTLQAQLDKSDPRTIPPSYWQSRQDVLARAQAGWEQQKTLKTLAGDQSPYTNVQSDGKGGFVGLNKKTRQVEQIPVAAGTNVPGGLDPAGLQVAAWENLLYGKNPPGMGNAASAQRAQVMNERARIGHGLGLTDMEMAMLPQDNKVKMKAVDALTKWGATIGRSAQKLELDMNVAIDYASKLPLGQVQSINRAIIAGRKEFNDPAANAYAAALNSVRQEYARLMSGPTSNAMLPVEAMKKGNELLSSGVDLASLKEVKAQMLRDAANTITATNGQINGLRGSIQNLGKGDYFNQPNHGGTPLPTAADIDAEIARRRKAGGGR